MILVYTLSKHFIVDEFILKTLLFHMPASPVLRSHLKFGKSRSRPDQTEPDSDWLTPSADST